MKTGLVMKKSILLACFIFFSVGSGLAFYLAHYEGLSILEACALGVLGGILCFFVVFANHYLMMTDGSEDGPETNKIN